MMTDEDTKQQVLDTLDGFQKDYDVNGIVGDVRAINDDVDEIPANTYWAIVARHEK